MLDDNKPSAMLLRVTHVEAGEPRSSITLDNSLDAKAQCELRQNVRNIAESMIAAHGIKQPGKHDLIEILSGRTANQIIGREDMLNDCRNLLIDLEDHIDSTDPELRFRVGEMLNALSEELGR